MKRSAELAEAEMAIDDEEKHAEEEPQDDDEEEEQEVPFLDTFYGLSSTDPAERAHAARDMLEHCLTGSKANPQDAAYALKRLMNALCSGRAAARQGNASALVLFLRHGQENMLAKIREAEGSELSNAEFVRQKLVAATSSDTEGKRKGSEERDDKFGRLFGILAIIKSSIILSESAPEEAAIGYARDLVELYRFKKWMREPAAHAICMLLQSLYASPSTDVVEVVVGQVIVPELLTGDSTTWCAEQVAVALYVQANADETDKLPAPLDEAILSLDSLPSLAAALSETSVVTQPRTHLVWDVLWMYLTAQESSKKTTVQVREIRSSTPAGEDSVQDLLRAVIHHVVVDKLLGKATHERRALALCIVRNLLGVEFVSSIAGRTQLLLGSSISVALDPVLVQRLFVDVIGASGKAEHMLKPLALQVLESVVAAARSDEDTSSEMRMSVLKALLQCDPRFDSRTKTSTVELLIQRDGDSFDSSFWSSYLDFVESQLLKASAEDSHDAGGESISPHTAVGYLDLLFHAGKTLARSPPADSPNSNEISMKSKMTRRLLDFFLVAAFFDCRALEAPTRKKTKRKEQTIAGIISAASKLQAERSEILPFEVRSVASARFFSLLSEVVTTTLHSGGLLQEQETVSLLADIQNSFKVLESAGCKRLGEVKDDDTMDTDDEKSPHEIVEALHIHASNEDGSDHEKRFANGLAILSSVVHLNLLSCGLPDNEIDNDDPDADDDEDREEITTILSDLYDLFENFSKSKDSMGEGVLLGLAELCTNALSSPLGIGHQSRGASPRLLREAIKIVWARSLSLASSFDDPQLDPQIVSLLLQAIGVDTEGDDDEGESDDENMEDDDEDVFGQAANIPDENSDSDNEGDKDEKSEDSSAKEDSDDDEVELDPTKLQSLLEEDIEDDESIEDTLEHHEGADAALAKLIQLKQEARKAGQKAKERLELARRLRCTLLLETLVSGKPEGWGKLLRVDMLADVGFSLLQYRKILERAVGNAQNKGADVTLGEKRALLDRISAIIKSRILKSKAASIEWSDDIEIPKYAMEMGESLLKEATQASSKEQQHFCSNTILWLSRALPNAQDQIDLADLYGKSIEEWSTKRTSRLETAFFDQLAQQAPVLAQAVLSEPLATACVNARTTFLKSESFRLLALLYNSKTTSGKPDLDELASARAVAAAPSVMESTCAALQDSEMKKSKRVREVLKTAEKVTCFLAAKTKSGSPLLDADISKRLQTQLEELSSSTESAGVKTLCDKVVNELTRLQSERDDEEMEDADDAPSKGKKSGKSKKKKPKSKKKKRR